MIVTKGVKETNIPYRTEVCRFLIGSTIVVCNVDMRVCETVTTNIVDDIIKHNKKEIPLSDDITYILTKLVKSKEEVICYKYYIEDNIINNLQKYGYTVETIKVGSNNYIDVDGELVNLTYTSSLICSK